MTPSRIVITRFSPTGHTRRFMTLIAQGFADTGIFVDELDVTDRYAREEPREFASDDLVFVGVPVYYGRVPSPMQTLDQWKGNGAVAVPIACYGCRAHEDALRELASTLRAAGFRVPAGAAFPTAHSLFPEFGAEHPTTNDREEAARFAKTVLAKLDDGTADFELAFPGVGEMRPYLPTAFVPAPDAGCRGCGLCTESCPVDIIDPHSFLVTDAALCIGCTACVDACPDHHRHLPAEAAARSAFIRDHLRAACAAPKTPEFFF